MSRDQPTRGGAGARSRQPRRVRLPGFINEEDIGLGDVVKRATSTVGIKPCGSCAERARRLNSWLVFTKRHS
jgi:hypothetical protein